MITIPIIMGLDLAIPGPPTTTQEPPMKDDRTKRTSSTRAQQPDYLKTPGAGTQRRTAREAARAAFLTELYSGTPRPRRATSRQVSRRVDRLQAKGVAAASAREAVRQRTWAQ